MTSPLPRRELSPAVLAAASRPNGPGRAVWLASYPKSGNTWIRAIITALSTHPNMFGVNQLGSGSQPMYVGASLAWFGLDPRWLSRPEIDVLRRDLVLRWGVGPIGDEQGPEGPQPPPILRKTHEVYRKGEPGGEPFPQEATRAAILIVRDPRDVACSYAPFFGVDLDGAVEALGTDNHPQWANPARSSTAQPWGTWSSHAAAWLAPDVPFPVHLVRYEDLKSDAAATLEPVFAAIGLECEPQDLRDAVARAEFDRLKLSESTVGFRETSKNTTAFFRKGTTGGWVDELSPAQVAVLETDHHDWMQRLGYPTSIATPDRTALADMWKSRRRAARHGWLHLPDGLGLTVEQGSVPEELPEGVRPRPWIQVNQKQAMITFQGGARLLVENGTTITVDWNGPEDPDNDPSWMLQGWGVTLAMLQRGDLSLHAATVRIGDEIVALAGNRGAGKSTTAMALRKRGHDVLIDDVTLIEFRDGEAWTTPYSRNVHLLPDAADALGLTFDSLPMLAGGRAKAAFRPEDPPEVPHKIDRIVILAPSSRADAVSLRRIEGGRRMSALLQHTRREGVAPIVLGQVRYFELIAKLAASTPVWALRRPRQDWTLDEVLDVLEGMAGQAQDVRASQS